MNPFTYLCWEDDGVEAIEWIAMMVTSLCLILGAQYILQEAQSTTSESVLRNALVWVSKFTQGNDEPESSTALNDRPVAQTERAASLVGSSAVTVQDNVPTMPNPQSLFFPDDESNALTQNQQIWADIMRAAHEAWVLPDHAANLSPITAVFRPKLFEGALKRLIEEKTILPKPIEAVSNFGEETIADKN